jgi:hypothetical protein
VRPRPGSAGRSRRRRGRAPGPRARTVARGWRPGGAATTRTTTTVVPISSARRRATAAATSVMPKAEAGDGLDDSEDGAGGIGHRQVGGLPSGERRRLVHGRPHERVVERDRVPVERHQPGPLGRFQIGSARPRTQRPGRGQQRCGIAGVVHGGEEQHRAGGLGQAAHPVHEGGLHRRTDRQRFGQGPRARTAGRRSAARAAGAVPAGCPRSASRWSGGIRSARSSTGWTSRWSAANGSSDSAWTPRPRRTRKSPAPATAFSSSAVLPMPGSPRRTNGREAIRSRAQGRTRRRTRVKWQALAPTTKLCQTSW